MPALGNLLGDTFEQSRVSETEIEFRVPVLNGEWYGLLRPSPEIFFTKRKNWYLASKETHLVTDFQSSLMRLYLGFPEAPYYEEANPYVIGQKKRTEIYKAIDAILGTDIIQKCSEYSETDNGTKYQGYENGIINLDDFTIFNWLDLSKLIRNKFKKFSEFEQKLKEHMGEEYPFTTANLPAGARLFLSLEGYRSLALKVSCTQEEVKLTFYGSEVITDSHIKELDNHVRLIISSMNDAAEKSADIGPLIERARHVKVSDGTLLLPIDGTTKADKAILEVLEGDDIVTAEGVPAQLVIVKIPRIRMVGGPPEKKAELEAETKRRNAVLAAEVDPSIDFDYHSAAENVHSVLGKIVTKVLVLTLNAYKIKHKNGAVKDDDIYKGAEVSVMNKQGGSLYKDDKGNYYFKCSITLSLSERHSSFGPPEKIDELLPLRGFCLGAACILKGILEKHCDLPSNLVRIISSDITQSEERAGMDAVRTTFVPQTELLIGPLNREIVNSIKENLTDEHANAIQILIGRMAQNIRASLSLGKGRGTLN